MSRSNGSDLSTRLQWVNDALDQQRRETWRELRQQAADLKKPSENPEETAEREESAKATGKLAQAVKGAQYAL